MRMITWILGGAVVALGSLTSELSARMIHDVDEIESICEKCCDLEKEIEELQREVENLEDRLSDKQEEIRDIEQQLAVLYDALEETSDAIQEVLRNIIRDGCVADTGSPECTVHWENLLLLNTRLDNILGQIIQKQNLLETLNAEYDQILSDLSDAQWRLAQAQAEYNADCANNPVFHNVCDCEQ